MAIQPTFSRAILDGTKLVEFRKRPIADDVRTVLVYETAPSQAIVGSFTVANVIVATPRALWRRFGAVAGISKQAFNEYYVGSQLGVALAIDSARRLARPVRLGELDPVPGIPQSFSYLAADALAQVNSRQSTEIEIEGLLERALSAATGPVRELVLAARALGQR